MGIMESWAKENVLMVEKACIMILLIFPQFLLGESGDSSYLDYLAILCISPNQYGMEQRYLTPRSHLSRWRCVPHGHG